jgi:hypothetical protein
MKRSFSLFIMMLAAASAQADILSDMSPFLSSSRPDYDYAAMKNDSAGVNPRFAPFSPADSDLGVQQILGTYEGLPPVEFRFDTGYNHTDSAPDNSPMKDTSSDFWASQVSVNWMPRLAYGWFLDIGMGYGWYDYDNAFAKDFETFDGHVGVFKSIPELDDLVVFIRYENQLITNSDVLGQDYEAQRIRLGVRKDLLLASRYQLSAGIDAAFDIDTNRDRMERYQYTADLRYTYWLADKLSASLSWTVSQWDFRKGGREDWNNIVGLEVTWTPIDHFSIFANVFYINHDSNTPFGVNDNEALQSGIGIGVNYSF